MKRVETYADFCREMMNAECDVKVIMDRGPVFTRWYMFSETTEDLLAYLRINRGHERDK